MTKQKILVRVGDPVVSARWGEKRIQIDNTVSVSIKYGSLKSAVNQLQQLLIKYRDKYEDLGFEEVHDCGCYYQCQCAPSILLTGKRYETDLEYQFRLDQTLKQADEKRKQDERDLQAIAKRLGKTVV